MSSVLKPLLIAGSAAFSLVLAGCGSAPGQGGSDGTPPAKGEPTAEEVQALLANLPEPYNAGDLENGRRVFARCRSCHTITDGGPNMTGPNLHGLFGRQVGTHKGYRYSQTLTKADFVWDAEKLDEWLERPSGFLPGNKMSFVGVAAEQDRRDVIAYLKVHTGYQPEAAQ
ncbi:cytochrome c family protein [uncultured Brevundimonas sp.]|uniref:c-type cytochrome n=1 Tax=uncultured Brevundimonas sp. TaxID=213418 RepID=UPI0026313B1D|nr:cytochrome c family protein [uncultured Brevundimonas sp.]